MDRQVVMCVCDLYIKQNRTTNLIMPVPCTCTSIVPATINVHRDPAKPRQQFLLVEIHNRNEKTSMLSRDSRRSG